MQRSSSHLTLNTIHTDRTHEIPRKLADRFDVVEKDVNVAGRLFHLLKVRDTNTLVDSIDPQSFAEDERLPYWADIWTSSLELARSCLLDFAMKSKRVLELGCGLGLSGIAAARAGAVVTFSDYEPDALEFCRYNAERNLTPAEFSTTQFVLVDWRRLPALQPFDMIVGADIAYERRNFFPLIDVLDKLLKTDGRAIITEPGRTIGEHFFEMLREHEFHTELSQHEVTLEGKTSVVLRAVIVKPRPQR